MNTSYRLNAPNIINAIFGITVFAIGLLNLIFVHFVPGTVCLLLSLIYFPQVNAALKERFGLMISSSVKVIMGIVVIWFTLGVSDLGQMIDDLATR